MSSFTEKDAAGLTDSTVDEVQEAWHEARNQAEEDEDNVWDGDRHADKDEYEEDPWDGEDE